MGCNLFFEQTASAIGQVGCSVKEASRAIGELSKAVGAYSHAEGYSTNAYGHGCHVEGCSSSLSYRQPTVLSRSPVKTSTIMKMSVCRANDGRRVMI